MNAWLWGATALVCAGLVPCLVVSLRGNRFDALVALEAASAVTVVALLFLAQGFERSSYSIVAVALAVVAFPGTLIFVRLLGRAP